MECRNMRGCVQCDRMCHGHKVEVFAIQEVIFTQM